jgi:sugar lactone lactonase YvrE
MASVPLEIIQGDAPFYRCDPVMVLGEAPLYRSSDSTLHWVECLDDPATLWILKVDPDTGDPIGSARRIPLTDSVSVACFRRNKPGSYICAYYQGVAFLDEVTGALEVVKEIIPTADRDERRFNDGAIDAKGRFWLAEIDKRAMVLADSKGGLPEAYGRPKGRLWRYDPDGSLHQMEEGFICGNGVVWSPDNKTSKSCFDIHVLNKERTGS